MNISPDDSPAAPPRILIVEDDREVAQAVAEMVRHLGYIPCVCSHADQVLQFVETHQVDLLLVDYRMPEMTGLDLIVMLQQENWTLPVIMMTGYAQTESRIPAEKRKEFIILKKPITPDPLAKAIEDSLKTVGQAR